MTPKPLDLTGDVGAPAQSTGAPSQNESTPPEQRKPDRLTEVSEGPDVGPAGEYRQARYKTRPRSVTLNGVVTKVAPNVREDR